MIIQQTPTPQLKEVLALLREQASWGNSRQQALALRIKIKAIEMTLRERGIEPPGEARSATPRLSLP